LVGALNVFFSLIYYMAGLVLSSHFFAYIVFVAESPKLRELLSHEQPGLADCGKDRVPQVLRDRRVRHVVLEITDLLLESETLVLDELKRMENGNKKPMEKRQNLTDRGYYRFSQVETLQTADHLKNGQKQTSRQRHGLLGASNNLTILQKLLTCPRTQSAFKKQHAIFHEIFLSLCNSRSLFELDRQARPGWQTGIRLYRPVLAEGQNKS
jgi:hypothetical protein